MSGHACGPAFAAANAAVADEVSHRTSPALLLLPLTNSSAAFGGEGRPRSSARQPCRKAKLPYSCLVHNEDGNLCSLCYNSAFNFLAFVTEANSIWLATSRNVSLCLVATSSINIPRTTRPCSLFSESQCCNPWGVAVKHTWCLYFFSFF